MRAGIEVLADTPGTGTPVKRHNWYQIRLKMWLHKGDLVRWSKPWGTSQTKLIDEGETLETCMRIDREQLVAGLFYGCEGMNVGGKRTLRISPHLAFGAQGVPGVVPPNALLIAELEIISEGFPTGPVTVA